MLTGVYNIKKGSKAFQYKESFHNCLTSTISTLIISSMWLYSTFISLLLYLFYNNNYMKQLQLKSATSALSKDFLDISQQQVGLLSSGS